MFEELNKYQKSGHFFFEARSNLAEVSKVVPNEPGVYLIYRLSRGKVELVYIGKSGTIEQNGKFKNQFLRKRLNNKQEGVKRQEYFDRKMLEENIDALDIYWYVTYDEEHQDLPAYVEGLIMQRYFETYGKLPSWNKYF